MIPGGKALPSLAPPHHPVPFLSPHAPFLTSRAQFLNRSCTVRRQKTAAGASWEFTTPGYKGLRQESSFYRLRESRQAASWASSPQGIRSLPEVPSPPSPLQKTFLPPGPITAWGRGFLTLPLSTLSVPHYLGKPIPSSFKVSERCGTWPRVGKKTWQCY